MAGAISTGNDVKGLVTKFRGETFWPQSLVLAIRLPREDGATHWILSRALTSPERNRLHVEAGQIEELLRPAETKTLRSILANLLEFWPGPKDETSEQAAKRLSRYMFAVNWAPAWAVSEVCADCTQYRIERNHEYIPHPSTLAFYVRERIKPFVDLGDTHRRMLEARVEAPIQRANAEKVQNLMRSAFGR